MLPDIQYGDLFTLARITMTFIGIASPNLSCERQYVWNEARSEWGIMSWAIRTQETLLNSSSKLQYMLTKMESGNTASRFKWAALSEDCQWILQVQSAYSSRFDLQELQSDGNLKCIAHNRGQLHWKKNTFKIWVGVLHMQEQYIVNTIILRTMTVKVFKT
jgi:hypothetical protein